MFNWGVFILPLFLQLMIKDCFPLRCDTWQKCSLSPHPRKGCLGLHPEGLEEKVTNKKIFGVTWTGNDHLSIGGRYFPRCGAVHTHDVLEDKANQNPLWHAVKDSNLVLYPVEKWAERIWVAGPKAPHISGVPTLWTAEGTIIPLAVLLAGTLPFWFPTGILSPVAWNNLLQASYILIFFS